MLPLDSNEPVVLGYLARFLRLCGAGFPSVLANLCLWCSVSPPLYALELSMGATFDLEVFSNFVSIHHDIF